MTALLAKLKGEPVAFWGGLVTAALAVMGFLGVRGDVIALVGSVATAVGIPIVRSAVSPVSQAGPPDEGAADTALLLLVATFIGVVLLLFGVHLNR